MDSAIEQHEAQSGGLFSKGRTDKDARHEFVLIREGQPKFDFDTELLAAFNNLPKDLKVVQVKALEHIAQTSLETHIRHLRDILEANRERAMSEEWVERAAPCKQKSGVK